jgi:hypothetical protein
MNEGDTNINVEGSRAVEQAEQKILGNENYQKVEVIHRFADTYNWVYPVFISGTLLIIVSIILLMVYRIKNKKEAGTE